MRDVTPFTVIPWDGQKISKPGIYSGIPMDFYHGDCCIGPSVSSGTLRKVEDPNTSMQEVWDGLYLNPDHEPQADKPSYIKGRAAHTLLLGEAGFREEFAVRPATYPDGASYPSEVGAEKPWNGNAKWCKAWLADRALAKKSVLKLEDVENIRGMAQAMAKHPVIQQGILNGLIEHSIFYIDEPTGLWVKSKPDAIPLDSLMISDLKGTEDTGPIGTRRSLSDYGYHQQMALITEAIYHVSGRIMEEHVLVFVKWGRPWTINIKPLTAQAIWRGRQQNRRALDRIAACLASGEWPGPDDDQVPADISRYLEDRLAKEEKDGLLPDIYQLGVEPKTSPAPEPEEAV